MAEIRWVESKRFGDIQWTVAAGVAQSYQPDFPRNQLAVEIADTEVEVAEQVDPSYHQIVN